jgi:DNA-binding transcriptional ArsR family regulator
MSDPLEEAIELRSRVRILGVISREKKLTVTQLSRITGLNHMVVTKSVDLLQRMGLVRKYRLGGNHMVESAFNSLEVSFMKGEGARARSRKAKKSEFQPTILFNYPHTFWYEQITGNKEAFFQTTTGQWRQWF